MNTKITREVAEAFAKCEECGYCGACRAHEVCNSFSASAKYSMFGRALLEEMDKPGVWDGAPEDATYAEIWFGDRSFVGNTPNKTYTREQIKSPSRLAAEKRARELYEAGVDAIADEIEKKEAGK